MRRTPLLGATAALFLLVGVTACSGDDGGGESEADLIAELSQTLEDGGNGLDEEQADCFAALIVEEAGVEALKDVDLSADQPPQELQEEIVAAAARATDECDLPDEGG